MKPKICTVLMRIAPRIGADPGFRQLVEALSRIQHAATLALQDERCKDGSAIILVLRPGDTEAELLEDGRHVRDAPIVTVLSR